MESGSAHAEHLGSHHLCACGFPRLGNPARARGRSCLRGALRMGSLRHPHLCRVRLSQRLLGSIHPLQASLAERILLAYGGGGVADRYMR
jgi:hypothetical protein